MEGPNSLRTRKSPAPESGAGDFRKGDQPGREYGSSTSSGVDSIASFSPRPSSSANPSSTSSATWSANALPVESNRECHGNSGGVDKSDRVQVLDNTLGPNVTAEHIDVKEGTFNGVVRGNTFNGKGITGEHSADSWVDVKGTEYLLENDTGTFGKPGTLANGYETHQIATTPKFPSGCGTTWRGDRSDLGGAGEYAIKITTLAQCTGNPNVVYASNTVTGAKKGLTNAPVTK